ncbi:hypothetical protein GLOIN_2v1644898 [Rhizophagus irregularis DAOM 181602=DAOM 197198]|nr:hypothetical protein GLOIN_2v1644898 [Rhizophagus irregularis DAOM 181602=DAOM 197198]
MTNINDDELIQGEEEIYADIFDGLLYKDLLQREKQELKGPVYLDKRHLQGWANFVKSVKLCLEPEISEEQIDDVQILLKKFSDYYEREYYQNNGQRLAASIFKENPLKQWSKERVFSTEGNGG